MAELTILCGGGGVGKTSTSAALGVALARGGRRTLVVTIDPARRLADALGVQIGAEAATVDVSGVPSGGLRLRMPEGRALAEDFITWLFESEEVRARLRANRAYHELANAIVGANELFSMTLIERDLQGGEYDHVVLDTAPSRHALFFLMYPKQLLDLLDSRALKWFAEFAPSSGASGKRGGLLNWGREKVEGLFARAIGEDSVLSIASLLSEVVHVRKRWSGVIRAAYERILSGSARFVLVGAPTGAAVDDVRYLNARVRALGPKPTAVVLNRADREPPKALQIGAADLGGGAEVEQALTQLRAEYERRAEAATRAEAALELETKGEVPLLRMPLVLARDPREVVLGIVEHIGPLASLL